MPATIDDGFHLTGFLDTSVLIRFVTQDNPEHSPRATELFKSIERGETRVFITDTVVFETAFTLEKRYRVPRNEIAGVWIKLLRLPNLNVANKDVLRETLVLWVERANLSFADAFHLVSAKAMGLDTIITFDRKMSIPGVTRVEPPLP